MDSLIPSGFDGNHFSRVFAIDLIADILNEERWEFDEISDKDFKRIIGRKSTRPIDPETERELFTRYRQGDSKARDALVFANLRLVNSIARHFKPHKLTCNDIISEGLVALLKALDGFDNDGCHRFSTYAYRTIYYHIHNFIKSYNSSIFIPSSVYSLSSKYISFCDKYFQENICWPSISEIAEALFITPYQANGIRLNFDKPVSIDHLCDFLGYTFVIDELLDDIIDCKPDFFDSSLNNEYLLSEIDETLAHLRDREADILRKSFGIGSQAYSLDEIGLMYDISRERIRQIRDRALRKLKGGLALPLRQYLSDDY